MKNRSVRTHRLDEFLGNLSFSALADLAGTYGVMRQSGVVPFGLDEVIWLSAAAAAPFGPLALTVYSLGELLTGPMQALF